MLRLYMNSIIYTNITRWLVSVALLWLGTQLLYAQGVKRNEAFMQYVRMYHQEARRQMDRHGVPASITIAQGIVETGAGKSTLASVHNNHFGIKCHRSWRGQRTFRTDDAPNECFRSYSKWQDSYEDHSLFLKSRRYHPLFALSYDDYRGWATGLQRAGYATNKGYANKLIKIIEDYELYTLDQGKVPAWMGGSSTKTKPSRKKAKQPKYDHPMRPAYMSYGLLYVLADPNDTYERIAEDMGISADKLARYNDTPIDYPLEEGDVVYLEHKKSRADRKYLSYVVRVGDSMHSISQRYGIKLSKLYKMNDLNEEYIPQEGDVLRLR